MKSSLALFVSLPFLVAAHPPAAGGVITKRSVTCLEVGTTATAIWTNSAGQSCSFVGVVGSNYGTNSAGVGE